MLPGPGLGRVKTLILGDCTEYTADQAKQHDPSAFLIDRYNWQQFRDVDNPNDRITGYTSVADLPKIDADTSALWELMQSADEIYYHPPLGSWSDDTADFSWGSQKTLTEFYLRQCHWSGKKVFGMDLITQKYSTYLYLVDQRTDDKPNLWVAGCSISHGVGIRPDEKYGTLVGKSLQKPTHHLARAGSSLEWQADQILRSDIRSADIVIWGLTYETRAPLARNGLLVPWPGDRIEDVEYLLHETRYYKAITSVYQVTNFCAKIGCRLILLPLVCSQKLQMDMIDHESFYLLPYQKNFLDTGTDSQHPGPKQHQYWADFCLDAIYRDKTRS